MMPVVKNLPANAGDLKDAGSILEAGRSPGGGHGNPLHYSCLENPMDRGAWRAMVHGVAKSQTRLKRLSTHTQGKVERGKVSKKNMKRAQMNSPKYKASQDNIRDWCGNRTPGHPFQGGCCVRTDHLATLPPQGWLGTTHPAGGNQRGRGVPASSMPTSQLGRWEAPPSPHRSQFSNFLHKGGWP